MQKISWFDGDTIRHRELPPETSEVVPGVLWGSPAEILSPAFWALQLEDSSSPTHGYINTAARLVEEVGFCLLGGFGVKVELAEAFHGRLVNEGIYCRPAPSREEIFALLSAPISLGGRPVRYRYPNQRASRLALAIPALRDQRFQSNNPLKLRQELQALEGIGPKTASWIVRNYLGSDEVAILDIHVIRACQVIGLFPDKINLQADYGRLEQEFLGLSRAMGVRASILDAVIWNRMRDFSPQLIQRLT